jgi:hypothetical protein
MNGALPATVATTGILASLLPAKSNPEVMGVTRRCPRRCKLIDKNVDGLKFRG